MSAKLKCGVLLSIMAIAGCGGGPTLDATDAQSFEASKKAMTLNMTDNQKRQFAQDLAAALGPEAAQAAMKRTFSKEKSTTSETEGYKSLHGMTVEQIQAQAEANRQKLKKP